MKRLGIVAILCVMWTAADVSAHDVSTSYSRFRVNGSEVHVQMTVGLLDFHSGPGLDRNGDAEVSADELDAGIDALAAAIRGNFAVLGPEEPTAVAVEKYALLGRNVARIDLLYTFAHNLSALRVTSTLHLITQPSHQHLLAIGEGDDTRQGVLDQRNPSVEIDLNGQSWIEVFWSFLKLGVQHIITGYDHLAFLAGLLIATSSLRGLVKVVTSFTVAHSVTLALAAFSVVSLPPRLIESLIALTIAYVAIENFTGRILIHRWKITFLFGLIHGFGFSNVLKEMALPRAHLAISLFSFNLGVETGQLFFVAVVFPVVVLALRSKWKEPFVAAASLAIMALGFYWFVERAFLT